MNKAFKIVGISLLIVILIVLLRATIITVF